MARDVRGNYPYEYEKSTRNLKEKYQKNTCMTIEEFVQSVKKYEKSCFLSERKGTYRDISLIIRYGMRFWYEILVMNRKGFQG